ncbi:hypothetical protein [Chitinophaga sp. 22620]|uniref:hypothetical protein n=1 Tax=Chitinophaga sp. 22620 TaxID=3453952 RepID=UPI003F84F680
MKHAYLLLLITGIFAAGCKKDKKNNPPSPETRIYGNWKQDGSLIQTLPGYVLHTINFRRDMSYTLYGGMGPVNESGAYTVSLTNKPDSVVLLLKSNDGGTRTLQVTIVEEGHLAIREYGDYYPVEY